MNRISEITDNELFRSCLLQIEECEKDRIFCRHGISHLLDVARIAYILKLERGLKIEREMIYAAALLHDIGRHEQYLNGISHDEAGARIAEKILRQCGFDDHETEMITAAVRYHREKDGSGSGLGSLLKEADRLSRTCFVCQSYDECKWQEEKKNGYPAY